MWFKGTNYRVQPNKISLCIQFRRQICIFKFQNVLPVKMFCTSYKIYFQYVWEQNHHTHGTCIETRTERAGWNLQWRWRSLCHSYWEIMNNLPVIVCSFISSFFCTCTLLGMWECICKYIWHFCVICFWQDTVHWTLTSAYMIWRSGRLRRNLCDYMSIYESKGDD